MRRTLENIPDVDVEQVVTDFESEGWTIVSRKQTNGTWTVVAEKPGS